MGVLANDMKSNHFIAHFASRNCLKLVFSYHLLKVFLKISRMFNKFIIGKGRCLLNSVL